MQKTNGGQSYRILLVHACDIYCRGLRSLIESAIAHAEVLEASDLLQASHVINKCDLVLVEFDISRLQSLVSLRKTCEASSAVRWAIVSATDTREDILAGLAAGFHGFISKHQSADQILRAINDLLSGRIYVPSSLANNDVDNGLASSFKEGALVISGEADLLMLSGRQREVLFLLARGMSNREIAQTLHIAESTTKIHTAAVLRALAVRNRTEAAVKAMKLINTESAVHR